jgi:hypothetical protein
MPGAIETALPVAERRRYHQRPQVEGAVPLDEHHYRQWHGGTLALVDARGRRALRAKLRGRDRIVVGPWTEPSHA